jgi:acetolactate synthase-1/2/3 large subunit
LKENAMRNKYEGGDLLVEALKQNGVREIFSLSGGPINSIYNAASNNDLPLIHVRHEQAAGYIVNTPIFLQRINRKLAEPSLL